jgi:hypothetical protein
MAKRARQSSDNAQPENVEVESQQTVDEAAQAEIVEAVVQPVEIADDAVEIADGDFIEAPFGAKIRSGTGRNRASGTPPEPRENTHVSGVNAGAHLNIYLSAALYAVAVLWELGAQVRWHRNNNGVPDAIRLRAATQKAYRLRHHGQQRPHFTITTASVGGASSGFDAVAVESWIDGDEIIIRLPAGIFADGEGQQ